MEFQLTTGNLIITSSSDNDDEILFLPEIIKPDSSIIYISNKQIVYVPVGSTIEVRYV